MKTFIATALFLAGMVTSASAQEKDAYRRSSLYSIMVINPDIKGSSGEDEAELKSLTTTVPKLFEATPIPDKYDNHCIAPRTLSLDNLPEANDEIAAKIDEEKGDGLIEKFGLSEKLGLGKDKDIIARLLTMFKNEHTAQQMISKWYATPDGNSFSVDYLLQERALNSRTAEENAKFANLSAADKSKLYTNISNDLVNKTFIMVNVYTYRSADIIKDLLHDAIVGSVSNPLAQVAATKTYEIATKNLKGYMCCYKTYLFRVNFDVNAFEEKWATGKPADFLKSEEGSITYVGKTTGMRPVGGYTTKEKKTDDFIKVVTERTIDESVAKLQKEYDEFKTLSTLRLAEDGQTLIAYIGLKEGIKSGDKFEVLEKLEDEEGNITYKSIGSVTAVKGKIWDNRAGSGNKDILDADENGENEEVSDVTATEFKGNAKKFANCLIRYKK